MKRALILFLCVTVIFSCKKEKKTTPDPEPEPIKTGTVDINVVTYDSLGNIETDFSGVRVSLFNTAHSATTAADGKVTFSNVQYGDVIPSLVKSFYEGPPVRFELNSSSLTVNLPFARYCAFGVSSIVTQAIDKDLIEVTINLDRAVPAGKFCKIAFISSDTTLSASNFKYVDTFRVHSQFTQKLNVAFMPGFRAALEGLKKGEPIYFNMIPVSYGPFESNLLGKKMLLGDNLFPPANSNFLKNWD